VTLSCRFLGRVPYAQAAALQERLVGLRRSGASTDTLLLLEHPPVVTLGRGARAGHLLLDEAALSARGIELHEAGRGGDVTFHGLGQLVGYPVVALQGARRDAHRYLRDLEDALIGTAAAFGVEAAREPGLTGAWVGRDKLAAIGVRIGTGWITSHGFALNVGDDLSGFDTIVPCGIRDRGVTSLTRETGATPSLEEVARVAADHVATALGLAAVWEAAVSSASARRESA
jgi:lipoyl(octanoyl) transferase